MEKEKYTEKELLELAGRMAIAAHRLLDCPFRISGKYIEELEYALMDYDLAVFSNLD